MQKLHNIFYQPIDPLYSDENGTSVVDTNALKKLIPFDIKDEWIVTLAAKDFGGNHTHPRQECWLAIGEGLELIWKDREEIRSKKMHENRQFALFLMPSHIPHAVINRGDSPAFLYEFADGPQVDVKDINLLEIF